MNDYFPLGLASNEAFCNRKQERDHVLSNIKLGKPTLIVSPRRYGKTSLVLKAVQESKLPYSHIDFFSEINQKELISSILKGIGIAIGKIAKTHQRAIKAVKEFFLGTQIKFSIDTSVISVEFEIEPENMKDRLKTILMRFDDLAKKNNKKVILFFDEFQRLGQIVEDHSIEAILRQIAQQSKNIVFIFSGSNRHLLSQIFDDRRRPFYKLCDRIVLERIEYDHYNNHIQEASIEKWRKKLEENIIKLILFLTERHPYYVNLLCSRIFLFLKLPKEQDVNLIWDKIALEEKSQLALEMDLLSDNQRILLITLAKIGKSRELLNKTFTMQAGLSPSSIAQSLAVLQKRDYIYKDKEGFYDLIDPLLRRIIKL